MFAPAHYGRGRGRDVAMRGNVTDEKIFEIMCHPEIPAPQMAKRLGVHRITVIRWRKRFREVGWTCRVQYKVCAYCGRHMTSKLTSTITFRHPECEEEYLRATRKYHKWTPEDDAVVLNSPLTIRQIADAIGATYGGVYQRRQLLRRRGLADSTGSSMRAE